MNKVLAKVTDGNNTVGCIYYEPSDHDVISEIKYTTDISGISFAETEAVMFRFSGNTIKQQFPSLNKFDVSFPYAYYNLMEIYRNKKGCFKSPSLGHVSMITKDIQGNMHAHCRIYSVRKEFLEYMTMLMIDCRNKGIEGIECYRIFGESVCDLKIPIYTNKNNDNALLHKITYDLSILWNVLHLCRRYYTNAAIISSDYNNKYAGALHNYIVTDRGVINYMHKELNRLNDEIHTIVVDGIAKAHMDRK